MKIAEARGLGENELNEKVASSRQELNRLKAQIASGTRAEHPAKFKNLRKDISRMLTILREKKLGIARKVKEKKAKARPAAATTTAAPKAEAKKDAVKNDIKKVATPKKGGQSQDE